MAKVSWRQASGFKVHVKLSVYSRLNSMKGTYCMHVVPELFPHLKVPSLVFTDSGEDGGETYVAHQLVCSTHSRSCSSY